MVIQTNVVHYLSFPSFVCYLLSSSQNRADPSPSPVHVKPFLHIDIRCFFLFKVLSFLSCFLLLSFSRSALSLSLSDVDGNLQSCHNSPTHRTSGLLPEICDSLTSRRQLCSASHPPVQHSSRFVNSFRPHLCGIHIPFATGVRCSSSPLRRVTISIHH